MVEMNYEYGKENGDERENTKLKTRSSRSGVIYLKKTLLN